jgi:hypothetical protein
MESEGHGLRRAVGLVALLNLAYFAVAFAVAVGIGSVSLFADSIDIMTPAPVPLSLAGRAGGEPELRVYADMLPTSPGEPDTGGLPSGTE